MNTLDKSYQNLLQDILDNGVEKKDRTGTGTISVFGRQIRHKMSEGFPLLTTKKMAWKTIVTELLWFLKGDTNIKYLVDNGCHIWDGDCYQAYLKNWKPQSIIENELHWMEQELVNNRPLPKDMFIHCIKTDDEFAKKWGELGPIYGKQWRSWEYENTTINDGRVKEIVNEEYKEIDQIQNLINNLKTNPDSRRLMVNAWNVGELEQMVLPPCHYGFEIYTRELSEDERYDLCAAKKSKMTAISEEDYIKYNIPTRAVSLMWNQRSVDTFLGLPFNIASYGLLLEMIADEVNMIPDELIGNLGDVHLYSNHIEQAKEQIGRQYTHEERVELLKQSMGEENYNKAVSELVPFGGGMSEYYESYKIPYKTREPYPLPTVHVRDGLFSYMPDDIILENYQSHPAIKAPLSN
jgi:thymidylate synthase